MHRGRLVGVLALGLVAASCRCGEPPGPVTVAFEPPPVPITEPEPEPEPVPTPEEPARAWDAQVVEATGRVEVKRGGGEAWAAVSVGDRLAEDDAVRTFDASRLSIEVSGIAVTVDERSELQVREVRESALRASFRGRVESTVTEGAGAELELAVEGTDAVVKSTGGQFAVNADGRGTVAVATVSGRVDFSARGKSVTVGAGEVSHAAQDAEPGAPKSALKRVMLSVNWPDQKETNQREVPVRGVVEVGARVRVQGQNVEVDEQGRFAAKVQLKHGEQTLAVVATDVLGRRAKKQTRLSADHQAPDVDRKNRPWE